MGILRKSWARLYWTTGYAISCLSAMQGRRDNETNDDDQCLVYEPLKIQERTASPICPSSSSSSSSSFRLRCRCCPRTSSPRARATLSFVTIMWSNDRHYGMRDQGSGLYFSLPLSLFFLSLPLALPLCITEHAFGLGSSLLSAKCA